LNSETTGFFYVSSKRNYCLINCQVAFLEHHGVTLGWIMVEEFFFSHQMSCQSDEARSARVLGQTVVHVSNKPC
jgi:uncharacterized membrane protein YciS (DUF1049 family)